MSEKIVVHNGSQRAINTPQGILPIGGSLEMDKVEADKILGYRGVRDAKTLVPQTADTIEGLKRRIAELEEQVKNLTAQLNGSAPKDSVSATEPEPELEEAGSSGKSKKAKR